MSNRTLNSKVINQRDKRGAKQLEAGDDTANGYDPAEPDADDKLPKHNNGSAADRARAHREVAAKKGGKNAKAQPFVARGGKAARDLQKPVGTGGGEKNLPVGKRTLT